MTDQTSSQNCPDCGNPLPEDSAHELCPSCLFRQALESRTVADPNSPPAPSPPPPSPEEMADKFPGFEITECLGRGGMGVVYKAQQKSLDRTVAIKILAPERVGDEKFSERFTTEAQTLAKLNHPNIVTVFDHGETGGLYYIVMEFVDGVNLRDLLREGKLDPKQALAIVPPVCEALQFAHDKGIVHRDIKPENLLLDKDGRIKIADFGIASLVGTAGDPAGTPPYMAPEQGGVSLEVDHRADIYALGAVLYETLTGERPGDALNPPSQKVEIDVRIDDIVLRALNKEPGRRYRTADEFRTMVQTVASTQPPPAPTEIPTAPGGAAAAATDTSAAAVPAAAAAAAPTNTGLSDPRWTRFAAYAMIGLGAINLLAPLLSVVFFMIWRSASHLFNFVPPHFPESSIPGLPFGSALHGFGFGGTEIIILFFGFGLSIATGVITLIGGRHMLKGTSRNWSIAGAVACCFSPVLWVLGVIVGIASFVLVLSNDGTVDATAATTPAPTADNPRFSKLAIVSASLQGLLAVFILLVVLSIGRGGGLSILAFGIPLLFLSLPATVLAWIAAGQIRRSGGALRGKRLAVVSGMLLPSLLAIPFLATGGALIDVWATPHPPTDDATTIIFGITTMLTFAAVALLGIRTCFRHLRGRPKNVLSKPVRIAAAIFVVLWIAIGGLLFVQRPQPVGPEITTDAPDRPFTLSATAVERQHLFGPDLLTYRFRVVGLNGTVDRKWEILVPWDQLSTGPEATSFDQFHFSGTDEISWTTDRDHLVATITRAGTTIQVVTIEPDGRVTFKTSN